MMRTIQGCSCDGCNFAVPVEARCLALACTSSSRCSSITVAGSAPLPVTRPERRGDHIESSTCFGSMPKIATSRDAASPASSTRSALLFPLPGLPATSAWRPYRCSETGLASSSRPTGRCRSGSSGSPTGFHSGAYGTVPTPNRLSMDTATQSARSGST